MKKTVINITLLRNKLEKIEMLVKFGSIHQAESLLLDVLEDIKELKEK